MLELNNWTDNVNPIFRLSRWMYRTKSGVNTCLKVWNNGLEPPKLQNYTARGLCCYMDKKWHHIYIKGVCQFWTRCTIWCQKTWGVRWCRFWHFYLFKVMLQLVFIRVMFVFYLSTIGYKVTKKTNWHSTSAQYGDVECVSPWEVQTSYCDQRLNDTNNKCN